MRHPSRIWWLLPLVACTPLGVWVYNDPSVTVSRVRVDAETEGTLPVVVALDVVNPNDYALSTTRLELRLLLDDLPIGQLDHDSSVALPKGTATVALPLVPDEGTPPARLQAFRSGVHRFTVRGRATFATPFGKQKVRFAQEGDLVFGSPALPASAPADPDASP
jgi:LEA14-like dessication related protein